jgi:hypothetical protein
VYVPDGAEMHRLAHIKKDHMTNQKTVEIKNMDKDDVYTLLGEIENVHDLILSVWSEDDIIEALMIFDGTDTNPKAYKEKHWTPALKQAFYNFVNSNRFIELFFAQANWDEIKKKPKDVTTEN